ncbi:MAG: hypothetical protein KAV82_13775 [Phycisphaerae bacterium]|nr:hypothetical protein [Phycisphaerae bacterium]
MQFYTLAVTGAERIEAIHSEFAGRNTSDLMNVLIWLGVALILLFALLVTINYVQQRIQQEKEAQHRAQMKAKMKQAQSPLRY